MATRVEPVTAGERLVAVGWIESRIRHADQRELLFELDAASRALFERSGKDEVFDLISRSYSNLLRRWEGWRRRGGCWPGGWHWQWWLAAGGSSGRAVRARPSSAGPARQCGCGLELFELPGHKPLYGACLAGVRR
jgi:hypothetical protein